MGKVIPMSASAQAREEARLRAFLVFECLPVIVPNAGIAERRKLATDILSLCAGKKPRRMTRELLAELVAIHSQCPLDQLGKCALTIFSTPLAWEINQLMGCADETDQAFRRVDPMCAARPLSEERFDGNVRRGHRDDDQA